MSLGSMLYVPTIKARQAEIKALLKAPMSLQVTPLFELQRASAPYLDPKTGTWKNTKTEVTDTASFLDYIAVLWPDPFYIDIGRVSAPVDRQRWWDLIAAINGVATTAAELIPVVSLDDDPPSLAAAGRVASITGRAALRVGMADPRIAAAVSTGTVGSIAGAVAMNLGLASLTDLDVVLDWKTLGPTSPSLNHLEASTVAVIQALGGQYGNLVSAGTPNDSTFVQTGDWSVARREWWLWLRLVHAGHQVVYGDYALYPPSDPVPAGPQYGHLRYSSGDHLHVLRRAQPSSGGGLGGAFADCCSDLVQRACWLGAAFSAADQRIADIAAGTDKENAAGKWREIAAIHHFALVAQQLAALPAAPPAGTP